jgi:hypothetical protein
VSLDSHSSEYEQYCHLREDLYILYSGYIPEDGSRRLLRNVGIGLRGVTLHKRVFFLFRGSGRKTQGAALAADFDNNFRNQSPSNYLTRSMKQSHS